MRHMYIYEGECPKQCGSKNIRVFGYCCSTEMDIVCQDCGITVRVERATIDQSKLKHTGHAELGFLGTEDARPQMRKALDEVFGEGTAEKLMGSETEVQ